MRAVVSGSFFSRGAGWAMAAAAAQAAALLPPGCCGWGNETEAHMQAVQAITQHCSIESVRRGRVTAPARVPNIAASAAACPTVAAADSTHAHTLTPLSTSSSTAWLRGARRHTPRAAQRHDHPRGREQRTLLPIPLATRQPEQLLFETPAAPCSQPDRQQTFSTPCALLLKHNSRSMPPRRGGAAGLMAALVMLLLLLAAHHPAAAW